MYELITWLSHQPVYSCTGLLVITHRSSKDSCTQQMCRRQDCCRMSKPSVTTASQGPQWLKREGCSESKDSEAELHSKTIHWRPKTSSERNYLRENCTVAGLNLHRVPIRKTKAPPKLSKSLVFAEGVKVIPPHLAGTESDAICRDMDTTKFKKTIGMTPNQTDGGQKFATTRLSSLMTTSHT